MEYMNDRQRVVYGCIDRLHYLWFESAEDEYALEKISALFDTLSAVAPESACCEHVHYLWLAYLSSKEHGLWCLARHRLQVFADGLERLSKAAQPIGAGRPASSTERS